MENQIRVVRQKLKIVQNVARPKIRDTSQTRHLLKRWFTSRSEFAIYMAGVGIRVAKEVCFNFLRNCSRVKARRPEKFGLQRCDGSEFQI